MADDRDASRMTVNGDRYEAEVEAAHDARRLPARHARAHRHARRLRARRLRRLHGALERQGGALVHHARGAGRRRRDRDRRGPRRRRHAAPDPAGVPREARPAVRLLHAGLHDVDLRAAGRGRRAPSDEEIIDTLGGHICRCTGYQTIVEAVHLAVEKMRAQMSEPRRRRSRSRSPALPNSAPRYVGQPIERRRGSGAAHRPDRVHRQRGRCRACSTAPFSAARTRTPASSSIDTSEAESCPASSRS